MYIGQRMIKFQNGDKKLGDLIIYLYYEHGVGQKLYTKEIGIAHFNMH